MMPCSIWRKRNLKCWEDKVEESAQVKARATQVLQDWKVVGRGSVCSSNAPVTMDFWVKPRAGWLKCNIDAVFFKEQNRSAVGRCFSDEQGTFVLAKTGWYAPLISVQEGEAIALLSAIQWVLDLRLEKVIFEVD